MSLERNLRRILISLGCSLLLINPALDVGSLAAPKSRSDPLVGTGEEHHFNLKNLSRFDSFGE